MGSSSSRKSTDTVRINPPAQKPTGDGTGNGGVNAGNDDINAICPVKFRVLLTRQDLAAGLTLELSGDAIFAHEAEQVGRLSKRDTAMIQKCAGLGINYLIHTVIDRGTCYAEFSQ